MFAGIVYSLDRIARTIIHYIRNENKQNKHFFPAIFHNNMEANYDKLKLAAAIFIPNVGNIIQKHYIDGLKVPGGPCWYTGLKKPWYTPPNYIFPPMWLAMYSSLGYASYLVWQESNGLDGPTTTALLLYGSHLISQFMWSPIFFKHHSIKWVWWTTATVSNERQFCNSFFGYRVLLISL